MKIISDIRFFKSEIANIDGNSLPSGCCEKNINVAMKRVVMKLREKQFSLGDFDQLYVNFTTCVEEKNFILANRSIDRYHPWYRYYDVGISPSIFNEIGSASTKDIVLGLTEQLMLKFFSENEEIIRTSFEQANSLGENMLMKFKEKHGAKYDAVIFLRYLNSGDYYPLLCVYDKTNKEVLKADLPVMRNLDSIGEIQITSKKVTIKSRKKSFAKNFESLSFEL